VDDGLGDDNGVSRTVYNYGFWYDRAKLAMKIIENLPGFRDL
jgi:hypothetical protein